MAPKKIVFNSPEFAKASLDVLIIAIEMMNESKINDKAFRYQVVNIVRTIRKNELQESQKTDEMAEKNKQKE